VPQKKMTITTTHGQGLYEFTSEAERFVKEAGVDEGLLTVFVRHTSCSLLIQENADPDVRRDLAVFFSRLVPPSDDVSMRWVVHTLEGPDDMPAHIKSALTAVSRSSPVMPNAASPMKFTQNLSGAAALAPMIRPSPVPSWWDLPQPRYPRGRVAR